MPSPRYWRISYSPDLRHWGNHRIMLESRLGGWWDANKIGLSCPPIETPRGWLVINHGVRQNAAGSIYRLGLALFDLNAQDQCLKRSNEWLFGPEEPYEVHGDVTPFGCTMVLRIRASRSRQAVFEGCSSGLTNIVKKSL
jgi:predicted GH43/DUF377 family glycosyl hydrolase